MKNLNIKTRCPKPFDTVLIDKNGSCFPCECGGWLTQPIGNIQLQSLTEILKSDRAKQIQQSILQGTYQYCNEHLCSYLVQKSEEIRKWSKEAPKCVLKEIRLGHDDSCNLSCPSCRMKKIFEKRGIRLRNRFKINRKIIDFLNEYDQPILVHIGSDGDPFASLVYRDFIKHRPLRHNIRYSLQTNGLLIKKMYLKNQSFFDQIDRIGLSIDGCTAEVYQELRRGGSWKVLLENLYFLNSIRQKHNFEIFFHCVVQEKNYSQMIEYVNFAELFGADKIWFNRIVDWKTYKDFSKEDVADPGHPRHQSFIYNLEKLKDLQKTKTFKYIEFHTLENYKG